MDRILVVRGGAIGDFILTLPAVKALRDAYPQAHLEILGYKHIAALAEDRWYAQAVRSIESATLSSFFAKDAALPPDLCDYFARFDLIVSYLYDPDRIFETNLRRSGVRSVVFGTGKIDISGAHAARQLAEPLLQIGIKVDDFAAKLYPSSQDRQLAAKFLESCATPLVALHPGSGSEAKNWALQNWTDLGNKLVGSREFSGSILVIGGEADDTQMRELESAWRNKRLQFAKRLPLPELAAILQDAVFIGHDSGISHLAAATGASCLLLFGPTNPDVWAPLNENVRILRAASRRMEDVDLATVAQELMRIGIST